MKRGFIYTGASTAFVLGAAACGTGSTASSPAPSTAPSAATGAAPSAGVTRNGTTISVASTKVGQVLVDGSGRTVYLFEADKGKDSSCYNACAQAWPPVTTAGGPQSGNGASDALLGTNTRTDGTTEFTYGGHPLYYFIAEKKAGDTTGQGINQFGAKWYVLAPSGKKIDNDRAAVPPSTNHGYSDALATSQ
jgi:predicted lipoprotein with Yx(FWY)xxD motif